MQEQPELRRAEQGDAATVASLARLAYEPWVAVVGGIPEPMQADYAEVLRTQEVWLAELGGTPVASLALAPQADHLLIWSIAVRPDHHGGGLGRRLLGFAEARARALRLPEMRLYTNVLMRRNIAIYERFGYRPTRQEAKGDRTVQHMAKRLG